jgi:hypothetical protein
VLAQAALMFVCHIESSQITAPLGALSWFHNVLMYGGEVIEYSTMGVSHCDLAIYIKKYLMANEELWKLKYFTIQKYNLEIIL